MRMKLSGLLGKEIIDISVFIEIDQNKKGAKGLDYCTSYLTLNDGTTFILPKSGDKLVECVNRIDIPRASIKISKELQELVIGQTIKDVHVNYYDGEPDDAEISYLELGNGHYVSEIRVAPHGVDASLYIYSKEQFNKLIAPHYELRSFLSVD